jgi:type IV pilus assembly protein PilB
MKDQKKQKKIGELLIESGKIDLDLLKSAIRIKAGNNNKIASILTQIGDLDEKSIAAELGRQLGLQSVALEGQKIRPEVISRITSSIAKKHCIIPVDYNNHTLTLAMSDPTNLKTIDELSFSLGLKIKPVVALENSIKKAQARHYKDITYEPLTFNRNGDSEISEDVEIQRFDEKSPLNNAYHPDVRINTLIELLIEKNIINRSELSRKLRKKLENK